ncbi:hypothetical protein POJ06DRAFT_236308 [Lipomyces tetrasporus]|uniref:Major facilitator superfamily (MFS) profile domain-containing protein n=1 Tax=Lipomyces tetrasporus TaxID=54092 RepID=A0AAD7QUE5_9ASCO|nr:uncharacterized protein POJ06DRAFT_236308 [Lipomyces tetrasporus]KAJ8101629.1 hypothetical protein POJ06DRAFT_236308 [Lipomyces tetrasporus]
MATLPDACTRLASSPPKRRNRRALACRITWTAIPAQARMIRVSWHWVACSTVLTSRPCLASPVHCKYRAYYGNPRDLGATQGGITDAIAAGSLVSALCSSVIGDRKVAIQLGIITWRIGASLQAASNAIEMLIMGRISAGF